MDAGFIRTRRNLIIYSIVLFLIETKIITPEGTSLVISGFEIEEPQKVTWMLWVFLIYMMVRYYQQLNETQYDAHLENIKSTTEQTIKNKYKSCKNYVHSKTDVLTLEKKGIFKYCLDHEKIDPISSMSSTSKTYKVDATTVYRSRVMAVIKESVNTVFFTEFIFPIFLCYIPLFIKLFL